MSEFHYFQTPIYRHEHPEWVKEVNDNLDSFFVHEKQRHLEENHNWQVFQTENLIFNPKFEFLADYFFNSSVDILNSQGYDLSMFDLGVSNMWGQKILKHGIIDPHVHPNSQICGLFFLTAPENGSFPIFSDPRPSKIMNDLPLREDGNVYVGSPKIYFPNILPGSFLFFNSWVPHQITANQSEESTKLVHFILSYRARN